MDCDALLLAERMEALSNTLFGGLLLVALVAIGLAVRKWAPSWWGLRDRIDDFDWAVASCLSALAVGLLAFIGAAFLFDFTAVIVPQKELPEWCFVEYRESREAAFDILKDALKPEATK